MSYLRFFYERITKWLSSYHKGMTPKLKRFDTSDISKKFHSRTDHAMQKMIGEIGTPFIPKKLEVAQRFNEFTWRLDQRFLTLCKIEQAMFFDPDKLVYSTHDIQLEFVNRVEAYFQQMYAAISAFVLYLTHMAPKEFKREMPFNSIEKFLKFLEKRDALFEKESKILERARDFRARFIDHTQQHILHDWETSASMDASGHNSCTVIYFNKKSPSAFYRGVFDPRDARYEPSGDYETFYVSPSHREAHAAFYNLCENVIKSLHGNGT